MAKLYIHAQTLIDGISDAPKQEEKRLHMPKAYKVLKTPYMQVLTL